MRCTTSSKSCLNASTSNWQHWFCCCCWARQLVCSECRGCGCTVSPALFGCNIPVPPCCCHLPSGLMCCCCSCGWEVARRSVACCICCCSCCCCRQSCWRCCKLSFSRSAQSYKHSTTDCSSSFSIHTTTTEQQPTCVPLTSTTAAAAAAAGCHCSPLTQSRSLTPSHSTHRPCA